MAQTPDVDPEKLASDIVAIRGDSLESYIESAVGQVASLVASTFGPHGSSKLIEVESVDGTTEMVLTRDAAEVLDAIDDAGGFNDPVAAYLVECIDSMQRGLSDGVTTALILTDAFVSRGSRLIDEGVRPGNVALGYAIAANRAGRVIDELVEPVDVDARETLAAVAETAMTIDLEGPVRREYAGMAVEAVADLRERAGGGWIDTDDVKVLTRPGVEAELVRGTVVTRKPGPHMDYVNTGYDWRPAVPEAIADAGVVVLDAEPDFEDTATHFGPNDLVDVRVESPEAMRAYLDGLDDAIAGTVDDLRALGVDVVFCQERVDADLQYRFEAAGIVVVDEVKYPKSDVHRIARATDAAVVSSLRGLDAAHVGTAAELLERTYGDEKWTTVRGEAVETYTLVLPSQTDAGGDEIVGAVDDAIDLVAMAVMDGQVVPGAGATAMAVAADLREYAPSVAAREQLAIEAFAESLEDLVGALARECGLDPLDAVSRLRAAQRRSGPSTGLDPTGADPVDAWAAGVVEPRRVFSQALETARLVAEQLLMTDAVLVHSLADENRPPS